MRRATGTTTPPTAHFDVSETGALVYVPGPRSPSFGAQFDLAFVDRHGQIVSLGLPAGPYEAPRVSPDGTRVAFGSDDGTDVSVWIYELSGANAMRKLTLAGRHRYPVWTRDSQRVAFQSDREGDLGIFWQRADGTGAVERLTKADAGTAHAPESWSRNGGTLVFSATRDARASLWTLSLRDKTIAAFGEAESLETMDPSFSPDGRWIAYEATDAARNSHIYVEPFPRTGERPLR